MQQVVVLALSLFHLAACASTEPIRTPGTEVVTADAANDRASLYQTEMMQSVLLGRPVTYHVYLPRSYGLDSAREYPVVYWLHGSGGYPRGALAMLAGRFDRAMSDGKMPEAIIVLPDGFEDTLWINSKDGTSPVESFKSRNSFPISTKRFERGPSRRAVSSREEAWAGTAPRGSAFAIPICLVPYR